MKFCIAYFSPNGSTAKVAEAMTDQLAKDGTGVALVDIAERGAHHTFIDTLQTDESAVLLVGSPVYRNLAVPTVMRFLDQLPLLPGRWAVPFVTWGRACSGVALWQMGGALQNKGLRLAAAAKVVALHSLMWQSEQPEGKGHPDVDDLRQVREMVGRLSGRLSSGRAAALNLDDLDYQPEDLAREFKAKIGEPWAITPKTLDAEACTECGICAENCPAGAIVQDPKPIFDDSCISCLNCVHLCPEQALAPATPMAKLEAFIRGRVQSINELPLTQIFWPQEAGR